MTLESDSGLLFSLLLLNPNLLPREEALELREPVLKDRFRFNESEAEPVRLPPSVDKTGVTSNT